MNYENFDKVAEKVKKIKELEHLYNQLTNDGAPTIRIDTNHTDAVQMIGTGPSSDHDFAELGREFLDKIIQAIANTIYILKTELKEL